MSIVDYKKSGSIATITFRWTSPGKGPTPTDERDLAQAISDVSRDPSCRAAVLTGSGETFCGEWTDPKQHVDEARRGFSHFAAVYPISNNTDKPVIAAINGLATGRGFELALDCDVRMASDKAVLQLGTAEHDRRLIYMAQALPRMIPFGEAMRLLLTNAPIGAVEGKRIGLIQDVVPQDRLLAEAVKLAESMATVPLAGLTATKKIGMFWRNLMLNQSYELTRTLMTSPTIDPR